MMKREDAEEFTQSVAQMGEGWWRQLALGIRLGVPKTLGYKGPDGPRNWVHERISDRVRVALEEQKAAIIELKEAGLSQRKIAAALGVGVGTVNRALNEVSSVPDGTLCAENSAEERGAEVSSVPDGTPGHHLARNTGNNEWYTPAEDIERARKVLGKIELDPASSDIAQETVKAERHFTKEQDGLAQEWAGTVWMNPPYAKGDIEAFVAKLVAEYSAGNVKAAIMLTNNSADTEWFHKAAAHAGAICLTRGRIRFEDPNSDRNAPLQGQAFFYFGPNVKRFVSLYAPTGVVLLPYRG